MAIEPGVHGRIFRPEPRIGDVADTDRVADDDVLDLRGRNHRGVRANDEFLVLGAKTTGRYVERRQHESIGYLRELDQRRLAQHGQARQRRAVGDGVRLDAVEVPGQAGRLGLGLRHLGAQALEERRLARIRAEGLERSAVVVGAGSLGRRLAERIEATLKSIPEYVEEFKNAFGGKNPITITNAARALAAFETTLITPNAPFDRFLKGDNNALSKQQKEGLALFMDTGCTACHNGVNVGGQAYFPFGVVKKPGADILPVEDKGRFAVTNTASDEYVFRASPLRNVAITPPYFHSGEVWDLNEAVAIMGDSQLGRELKENEIDAIAAFLHSLTGDQPKITLPILPPSSPTTPKPDHELPAQIRVGAAEGDI